MPQCQKIRLLRHGVALTPATAAPSAAPPFSTGSVGLFHIPATRRMISGLVGCATRYKQRCLRLLREDGGVDVNGSEARLNDTGIIF